MSDAGNWKRNRESGASRAKEVGTLVQMLRNSLKHRSNQSSVDMRYFVLLQRKWSDLKLNHKDPIRGHPFHIWIWIKKSEQLQIACAWFFTPHGISSPHHFLTASKVAPLSSGKHTPLMNKTKAALNHYSGVRTPSGEELIILHYLHDTNKRMKSILYRDEEMEKIIISLCSHSRI